MNKKDMKELNYKKKYKKLIKAINRLIWGIVHNPKEQSLQRDTYLIERFYKETKEE